MTPEGLELINERARDNNVGLYHSWLVDRDHWNALVEEIREQWAKVAELKEWQYAGDCQCDPPGSGEEWCKGVCFERAKVQRLREALIGIRGLEGDPIGCISEARDLAREALEETK